MKNNRLCEMALPDSFIKRSVSAVVFAVVAIFCCLFSRYTLMAFIMASSLLLVWEYHSLTLGKRFLRERIFVMLADASFLVILPLSMEGIVADRLLPVSLIPAVAVIVSILFSSTLKIRKGEANTLDPKDAAAAAEAMFPLIYITAPLASLFFMTRGLDGSYRHDILLAFGAMVFGNDVFAYLFGMFLGQKSGRKKLFPSLSPKKSRVGAVGGIAMTSVISVVCSFMTDTETMNLAGWIFLSLLISISGIFGDLFESLVKRYAGAKDAGHIMPGHGGLLDRFDALLLAAPVAVIYLSLLSII